jgi:hypothetical protein
MTVNCLRPCPVPINLFSAISSSIKLQRNHGGVPSWRGSSPAFFLDKKVMFVVSCQYGAGMRMAANIVCIHGRTRPLRGIPSFVQRACKSDDVFIVRSENPILQPQLVDVFFVSRVALFSTLTFKE